MIKVSSNISSNDLKEVLKHEIKKNSLNDLYNLSSYFKEETKHLPEKYKNNYTKSVLNIQINRLKSLQNDKKKYEEDINNKDIKQINELLNEEDDNLRLLNILAIYATYFLKEPIHPPETLFPGLVKIRKKGKEYYCPIKKYHINNDKSLCKFCIANILEE